VASVSRSSSATWHMIKVGSLVVPVANDEFLFVKSDGFDYELDPIEAMWEDGVGVVLEILDFDPPRDYKRVRIMTGKTIGWTYSDYVVKV